MDIKTTNITARNIINKYNNSIFEASEDEEFIILIDMYSAS
jgi:mannose/fructose-specific phosphotransferase system component IIA